MSTPKLTPAIRSRIAGIVRRTGNYTDAARSCRIDYSSVRRWRRLGEAVLDPNHPDHPETPDDHAKQCAHLVLAVAEAEGLFLSEGREEIRKAGTVPFTKKVTVRRRTPGKDGEIIETEECREEEVPPDWRALAWGVDRHSPPRQAVELSGVDGGPIEIDVQARADQVRDFLTGLRGEPAPDDDAPDS